MCLSGFGLRIKPGMKGRTQRLGKLNVNVRPLYVSEILNATLTGLTLTDEREL